jgi:glycosyltransferase involved in cell wall biosynthesis
MSASPLISVIMPVFNGEIYLSKAIESILNQTLVDFEFIIINDGSTDNSINIIKKYADIDNRINIINRENKGLVFSLNEGINISKGKYIARMDADDISSHIRFEKQLELLENECGDICGCHFTFVSESNKIINNFIAPITKESINCFLLITNPYAHGSVMIRREFIINNMLFYKDVKAEDHRLWCDFYIAGAKFVTVNDFLFFYRDHNNSISSTKEKSMFKEVYYNGSILAKNYHKNFKHDLFLMSKQELSFLEEQLFLMAAYKYSVVNGSLIVFKYLNKISFKAIILSVLKIIARKGN